MVSDGAMPGYLATFVTGLEAPFRELLVQQDSGARVARLDSGICAFESRAPEQTLAELKGARNVFRLLAESPAGVTGLGRTVETRNRAWTDSPAFGKVRGFWLSGWHEGEPVSPKELVPVETALARTTRWRPRDRSGLPLSVMSRRDGWTLLLQKLTKSKAPVQRGELPKDFAELLCSISGISDGDVFLDPFCGSGAIARARAGWPYGYVFCSDLDEQAVAHMKAWIGKRAKMKTNRFNVRRDDALTLERYSPGFVTRIVTDPPWGKFAKIDDIERFYETMLAEHARIVDPTRGVLVYLIGAKAEFECALQRVPSVRCASRYDVLVSGKKACVFELRPVSLEAR